MAEPPPDARLASLRRRWDLDKSPSASIPLAEEYRRQRNYGEATLVLEASLRVHPQHLSALAALGRIRLEAGDAAGAAAALVRVVERDPMQMVANKLLGEAYLALGQPQEAERRIRVYALLNDRDPDLPALQRRLREAMPGPSSPSIAVASLGAKPSEEMAPAAQPATPAREAAVAPLEAPIFRLGGKPEPAAAGSGFGDLWGFDPPAASIRAAPGFVAGEEAALFPPLGSVAARRLYLDSWRQGDLWGSAASATPVAAVGAGVAAPPVATVTLGDLYLGQGHWDDAGRVFGDVLERDPGNEPARRGLERAARGLAQQAPAALERATAAAMPAQHAALLRSWLDRIRANAGPRRRDVDVR